ncbi:MAG: hypothetical protein Q7W51_01580 [Coriobacteriia bacterium]|nr:hypothetical protein [Coriobacteriia bacterium]
MRRRWVTRCAAIATGALVLATVVPLAVPTAMAGSAPFAVDEDIIYAQTPVTDERFGSAVAIDGDTLVVGVPEYDTLAGPQNVGRVDVFVRSGTDWVKQTSLYASAPGDGDKFGTSVAISGDRIVVGAPFYYGSHGESGAAYVFTRTGTAWSAADMLPDEFAQEGDQIGQSVDIEGTTIVVGCPGDSSGRGAVRPIYWNGSDWDSGGGVHLLDPSGMAGDRLGTCVSLSGNTVLASAGGDDVGTVAAIVDAGSVLSFTRSGTTWSFEQKWQAPTPVADEQFGGPIDLQAGGYVAVIGSPAHDVGAEVDKGIAYVYARGTSGWVLTATLDNPGPNSPDGDWFGSAVAFDGHNLILIGAFWDDLHTGAAYYFQYREGEWVMAQKVTPDAYPCCALFGDSAALDGGIAMIGATLASTG